jgi:phage FluMu protein Com
MARPWTRRPWLRVADTTSSAAGPRVVWIRAGIRAVARPAALIAYHLCCPRCGFVNAVFHQHQGQLIIESEDGERVSFSAPVRCVFCNVTLHVTDSVAELEEGPDVRNVRYR